MAIRARRKALWFEVIPAVCAALSGALVSAGIVDESLLPFTILTATVSAVAAVLNPNRSYQEHLGAAKHFTAVKHDARFLEHAQSTRMTDDVFALAVENLHRHYNELLQSMPPTDEKSFSKAREIVQSGLHEPDKDEEGRVKSFIG